MKFDFGESYGNHGAKYFQDFRFHTLDSSRTNMCSGGMFPTAYSCSPNIAVESRTRKWDRWLLAPHYRLYNQDHDKREELIAFSKVVKTYKKELLWCYPVFVWKLNVQWSAFGLIFLGFSQHSFFYSFRTFVVALNEDNYSVFSLSLSCSFSSLGLQVRMWYTFSSYYPSCKEEFRNCLDKFWVC